MKTLFISVENAEYQIIKSIKLNRVKQNKLHEIFIEGTECINKTINANIEITRIIIKDVADLSEWGKDVIRQNNNAKIIEMPNLLYDELTVSLKDCKINNPVMLIIGNEAK